MGISNTKNVKFSACRQAGIFVFCILNFLGCASIKEAIRGIAGVSTKILQDSKKDAQVKTFDYDYNTCYLKVMEIIRGFGGYIYAKEKAKKMIAIYVSEEDTTPVGIFFEETDKTSTRVLISSPSNYAKKIISEKIFLALEESLKTGKVNASLDAMEGKEGKK